MAFTRFLSVPQKSFFLFGPRGVGKSTWLQTQLPGAFRVDLLEARTYLELQADPSRLEGWILGQKGSWIIIDEIQKLPAVLDEVHRLIEKYQRLRFALSGSSARKLRRGGANLLGGRAITLSMDVLTFGELGSSFDLPALLEWGGLPLVVNQPELARETLTAYVHTYLKEEVKEEGLVRKIDSFSRFLSVAGLLNGQILNLQNIAREASVSRSSLETYFEILEETLIGTRLNSYQPGIRLREVAHPKFYFFDPGVARGAAGLLFDPIDSVWKGFILETWILHELKAFNHVQKKERSITYYRTGADVEIDFIVETRKKTLSMKPQVITIEVKSAKKWDRRWERAARSLQVEKKLSVQSMWGVYMGDRSYNFEGYRVVPVSEFLELLWKGEIF